MISGVPGNSGPQDKGGRLRIGSHPTSQALATRAALSKRQCAAPTALLRTREPRDSTALLQEVAATVPVNLELGAVQFDDVRVPRCLQQARPGVHQPTALLKGVSAPVRPLNGISDEMGQRGFRDLARE